MLWLYRLLFLPFLVVAAPFYLLRMKRRGGYRRHFKQRFGAVGPLPERRRGVRRIWIQAVSVGEVLAIAPLLEAFKKEEGVEVYLTTTTSTGFKVAKERYQEATVGIGYFPIDWWLFSSRAWERISPDLVILTEGERWPEHVFQAARRNVPVICVNARLSDRSFKRMQRWKALSKNLLRGITRILACSELDAQRFRELGFPADAVLTTGNIKLDLTIPPLSESDRVRLRGELGVGDDLLLLGSSTWPREEEALLEVLRNARAEGVKCRLLLVPRHAERRVQIEALLKESGFTYHFRTRGAAVAQVDVSVADTTGELRRLSQLADLIFIGKSLPPHDQGQTPVEAAALAKPMLFGPGMSNFRALSQSLVAYGAAEQVGSVAALAKVAGDLLLTPERRAAMGAAAEKWHAENKGAVNRTLAVLHDEIAQISPLSPLDVSRRVSRR